MSNLCLQNRKKNDNEIKSNSPKPFVPDILPIQSPEMNREMPLFDLETLGFSTVKNATFIAFNMKKGGALMIQSRPNC